MISVIALRKNNPDLPRPFLIPFYPLFPIVALTISLVAIIAITVYNLALSLLFVLIIAVCFGIFKVRKKTAHA